MSDLRDALASRGVRRQASCRGEEEEETEERARRANGGNCVRWKSCLRNGNEVISVTAIQDLLCYRGALGLDCELMLISTNGYRATL